MAKSSVLKVDELKFIHCFFYSSGMGTRIFREDKVNTIAADALAPYTAMLSSPGQNGCHLADDIF